MHLIGLATLSLLLPCTAHSAAVLRVDDFEYPGVAAARAAWVAADQSPPVELMAHESEGGKTALKFSCPFTRADLARSVYDRALQADLTRHQSITFDFYCDNTAPIRGGTIYFHAGAGWYGHDFDVAKGWIHVSIGRGDFGTEDRPAGWDKVDGVRICAWKSGPGDTFCAVDNLQARLEDVAVVRGSPRGYEADSARAAAEQIGGYLTDLGVPYGSLTDEDVLAGGLTEQKLAIFAYSPGMTDALAAAMGKFVAGGGKLIVFYTLHPKIADLLGATQPTYKPRAREGEFATVTFAPDALPGLPAKMTQDSWNINAVTPGGHHATAIGTWTDAQGHAGDSAVIVSDNGAYMGHILTNEDAEAKRLFLIALVGHFVPEAWAQAADHALARAVRVGPFGGRTDLEAWLRQASAGQPFGAEVEARLAAATQAEDAARGLLRDRRYPQVLLQAADLHATLADAYTVAHTARDGEFRAVWNHSGTGDCGTWEEAMKRLAGANFNAVVPNMWWAGVAHYDSKILPHSATFDRYGDQIAQAVAAGRKYGIEVHPWKVNWNLGNAPEQFVARMRAEKRLQMDFRGQEVRWLCPSNPDNFKLELDTMLEVVRNYDVDGVHFDYIRYPDDSTCYCDGCRERFEKLLGRKVENWPQDCHSGPLRAEYRQFRCDQITRLVRSTSEEARRIKPWVRISAAVFGDYPGCRDYVGQDWVLWCKSGWLDFVCPMDYTASDAYFRNLVSRQVGLVGGAVPVYSGVGQFIIPDDQMIGQMEIARECGASGFILFNMGQALAERGFPELARGITSAKAVAPHDAPLIRFRAAEDNDQPVVVAQAPLRVAVSLVSLGEHRKKAVAATGFIEVQDLAGKALARLGALPAVGGSAEVLVEARPGPFRLAAVGRLTYEDGASEGFITRSKPYRFGP